MKMIPWQVWLAALGCVILLACGWALRGWLHPGPKPDNPTTPITVRYEDTTRTVAIPERTPGEAQTAQRPGRVESDPETAIAPQERTEIHEYPFTASTGEWTVRLSVWADRLPDKVEIRSVEVQGTGRLALNPKGRPVVDSLPPGWSVVTGKTPLYRKPRSLWLLLGGGADWKPVIEPKMAAGFEYRRLIVLAQVSDRTWDLKHNLAAGVLLAVKF